MPQLVAHIIDSVFVGADEPSSYKLAENGLAVVVCLLIIGRHTVCDKELAQEILGWRFVHEVMFEQTQTCSVAESRIWSTPSSITPARYSTTCSSTCADSAHAASTAADMLARVLREMLTNCRLVVAFSSSADTGRA